ncbi:uncharacterized protein B0H18DRAFT_964202 [Fomitopsis serialis]|uniref:uncharacterized protein n=1 Tax=Fomitopsis serialis TaxID=139415 RepID=UPI002008CDC1|nr:uncharacterized protein B0H18DRAFT_964202 [Neoantrodia serialis]KAH9908253.1 hypothetical protein B0H18DRAFT_964202 [Neoantrodia serialis]
MLTSFHIGLQARRYRRPKSMGNSNVSIKVNKKVQKILVPKPEEADMQSHYTTFQTVYRLLKDTTIGYFTVTVAPMSKSDNIRLDPHAGGPTLARNTVNLRTTVNLCTLDEGHVGCILTSMKRQFEGLLDENAPILAVEREWLSIPTDQSEDSGSEEFTLYPGTVWTPQAQGKFASMLNGSHRFEASLRLTLPDTKALEQAQLALKTVPEASEQHALVSQRIRDLEDIIRTKTTWTVRLYDKAMIEALQYHEQMLFILAQNRDTAKMPDDAESQLNMSLHLLSGKPMDTWDAIIPAVLGKQKSSTITRLLRWRELSRMLVDLTELGLFYKPKNMPAKVLDMMYRVNGDCIIPIVCGLTLRFKFLLRCDGPPLLDCKAWIAQHPKLREVWVAGVGTGNVETTRLSDKLLTAMDAAFHDHLEPYIDSFFSSDAATTQNSDQCDIWTGAMKLYWVEIRNAITTEFTDSDGHCDPALARILNRLDWLSAGVDASNKALPSFATEYPLVSSLLLASLPRVLNKVEPALAAFATIIEPLALFGSRLRGNRVWTSGWGGVRSYIESRIGGADKREAVDGLFSTIMRHVLEHQNVALSAMTVYLKGLPGIGLNPSRPHIGDTMSVYIKAWYTALGNILTRYISLQCLEVLGGFL